MTTNLNRDAAQHNRPRVTGQVDARTLSNAFGVGGLLMWSGADNLGLADGAAVGAWPDQSGHGRDFTGSGTARPTYKAAIVNGLPVLRFDGVNDTIGYGGITVAQPNTYVIVANIVGAGGFPRLLGNTTGSGTIQLFGSQGGPGTIYAGSVLSFTQAYPTGWHVWTLIFNGAASAVRRDAVGLVAGNAGTSANPGVNLGCESPGVSFMPADVAEFVLYDHALNSGELALVENALIAKYGL